MDLLLIPFKQLLKWRFSEEKPHSLCTKPGVRNLQPEAQSQSMSCFCKQKLDCNIAEVHLFTCCLWRLCFCDRATEYLVLPRKSLPTPSSSYTGKIKCFKYGQLSKRSSHNLHKVQKLATRQKLSNDLKNPRTALPSHPPSAAEF